MKLFLLTFVLSKLPTLIYGQLITQYGWSIDAGIIITYTARSLANCRSECESRARCESVTYIRSSKICRLHQSMTSSEEGTIFRKAGSIYIGGFLAQQAPLCGDVACSESEKCDNIHTCPVCVVSECPDIEMSLTVLSLGNTNYVGSKRRFSCLTGSDDNGVPRATALCQADGHWMSSNISCKPDFKMKRFGMIPFGANEHFGQLTLSECITHCLNKWKCNAVGYNENSRHCALSIRNVFQVTYIDSPGWISVTKIKWPVWYSRGPHDDHYQLSFQAATEYCLSPNTTMASRADVVKALAQGMFRCGWAWISDGYIVISMQVNTRGCANAGVTNRKININNLLFDVYCKNSDYTDGSSVWH